MNLPAHFIPPLENGDRLTRSEFERRYEAIPQVLLVTKFYLVTPVCQALLRVCSHFAKQSFAGRHYQAELGSELTGWALPTGWANAHPT